ncbi:MAG: hypothetical protein JWM68_2903, partial [Verrucomicrobiales bacterium]|nr:hypothetical protein [Verrucomicrobiales bacterium]
MAFVGTGRGETIDEQLFAAAQSGNIEVVKQSLDRGAHVDARDDRGWTPLHAALKSGQVEVAKLLIQRGADLKARTKKGSIVLT